MSKLRCTYCNGPHRGVNCDRPKPIDRRCRSCAGVPWRRDIERGCQACGKPYSASALAAPEQQPRTESPISQFGSW